MSRRSWRAEPRFATAAARASCGREERSTRTIGVEKGAAPYSCCHPPSASRKRSRSASWCETTWCSASSRRSTSMSAGTSKTNDWFQWFRFASRCSKNQCWMGVNETAPSGTPSSSEDEGTATSATRLRPAIVGDRKRSRGVIFTPAARHRATTWMLRIESPPSSKKLSSTPTRSTPSTSLQTPAIVSLDGRARARRTACSSSARRAPARAGPCGRPCRWR